MKMKILLYLLLKIGNSASNKHECMEVRNNLNLRNKSENIISAVIFRYIFMT